MKALTISPGQADSAAVVEVPEPTALEGSLLVQALELGLCGTDFELISAEYGWAPPGKDQLIIGHESLGRVIEAPENSGFAKGDLIVGIVRHSDPVPCIACGAGEFDMCRNGQYTERGIKELNGFASERWRTDPQYAVKLDGGLSDVGVLTEPASILAKAWDHIEKIGQRATWKPKTALITGAGPVGLLGAMMGVQRGLEVHVLDRVQDGPKPKLVADLGATYLTGELKDIKVKPDVIIESTGVASVIVQAMEQLGTDGILCLTGISSEGQNISVDMGQLNRTMVLENNVIFGSVNANHHHWQLAEEALRKADRGWLSRLITRRESLQNWKKALERHTDDIKVILDFGIQ